MKDNLGPALAQAGRVADDMARYLGMRHKVSDLEGPLLDAAVAKAQGWPADIPSLNDIFRPSTDWLHGGPIIEREDWLLPYVTQVHRWHLGRYSAQTPGGFEYSGRTPLIAAMRAYVASKLGEEIDLP